MSKFAAANLNVYRATDLLPVIAALIAFWPVWYWYCQRVFDRSDEPLGIVALITFLGLILWRRRQIASLLSQERSCRELLLALALVVLYCMLRPVAPDMVLALIAILAVGICLLPTKALARPVLGDWILLLLSLPLIASLNFYTGYPLRVVACHVAASLLNLGGLAVSAQGAEILCNNSVVGIDQPCSGIKMLWVATYLAATLCSIRRLNVLATVKVLTLALVAAIIANAIRVSSLFYTETKIVDVGEVWHGVLHAGIGVAVFALLAAMILATVVKVSKVERDEAGAAKPCTRRSDSLDMVSPLVPAAFAVACCTAMIMPLLGQPIDVAVSNDNTFSGWPARFEGRKLNEVPLSPLNARFANGFPGRIAVFSDGDSRVIFRWVTQATRQLHPSANCYKAGGYQIKWLPEYIDRDNHKWTAFEAARGEQRLLVRERIFDSKGHSWTDASSWYWSAVLKRSHSPWWAVSTAKRLN